MKAVVMLILAATSFAQNGFIVESNGRRKWPADEMQKVYDSACAVVQQEFGAYRTLRPRVRLVLGADKNTVNAGRREISS